MSVFCVSGVRNSSRGPHVSTYSKQKASNMKRLPSNFKRLSDKQVPIWRNYRQTESFQHEGVTFQAVSFKYIAKYTIDICRQMWVSAGMVRRDKKILSFHVTFQVTETNKQTNKLSENEKTVPCTGLILRTWNLAYLPNKASNMKGIPSKQKASNMKGIPFKKKSFQHEVVNFHTKSFYHEGDAFQTERFHHQNDRKFDF